MQENLTESLKSEGLPERLIEAGIDSGFFLKSWVNMILSHQTGP
jgi:hypothetical protein